ncbi:MAG TPA: sulfurtransferase TusA family protein, partial [Phaeodactylibacter sp.]|nr:sulfurtransferase TusA family protein [Phaeodactylibacter sp.]
MADVQISKQLDCKGLCCPMPVIKTKKAIKDLQPGEVLEMIATDPGSIPDMEAWARQTGHKLLQAQNLGDTFRFLIEKKGATSEETQTPN